MLSICISEYMTHISLMEVISLAWYQYVFKYILSSEYSNKKSENRKLLSNMSNKTNAFRCGSDNKRRSHGTYGSIRNVYLWTNKVTNKEVLWLVGWKGKLLQNCQTAVTSISGSCALVDTSSCDSELWEMALVYGKLVVEERQSCQIKFAQLFRLVRKYMLMSLATFTGWKGTLRRADCWFIPDKYCGFFFTVKAPKLCMDKIRPKIVCYVLLNVVLF